jgi:RNA polymerase sigma factor (sigma-70 family)
MSAETDDDLMTRFQREGHLAAFEQLFARNKDGLLRFLLRLVANHASAEDASQQTWLKVIEVARKGSYATEQVATFRTWLFTVARNHVIDAHQRKLSATRTVALPQGSEEALLMDAFDVDTAAADPAAHAIRAELTKCVHEAVATLPLAQREVIVLWASGIDPMDIATITNAPRETVLSRKKYAMAKLREALRDFAVTEQQS